MILSGAQMLLECLRKENVEVIFGHPGGVVLSVYDALADGGIRHVLMRHEQAAAHAADGYSRASGRVGVCLATSGPGATNVVTGVATAYMDSIPVVFITGQVSSHLIGNDAFQEADVVGMSRPCTKHNTLVRRIADLPRSIKEAFYIASTGRPGPVLVDITKDVFLAKAEFEYPESVELRGYRPLMDGHMGQIRKAARAILDARRPVIYAGGGVIHSGGTSELAELAELLEVPVTLTLMGLGAFPSNHPLCLGMLGMHGRYSANLAVCDSDVLIAVGARFDDRVTGKTETFAPNARIIHIDIDPTSIQKNIRVDIPIVGDVKRVLRSLCATMRAEIAGCPGVHEANAADRELWRGQIREWQEAYPLQYDRQAPLLKPQSVIEEISNLLGGEAIITTDVGQHQMWAAQFMRLNHPRTFLSSGGLGTMGYGFPAALGAQLARPSAKVVAIVGDGGFQMTMQELATIVQNRIPVKIVVINNRYLGMVRQWQDIFFKERYSETELGNLPDLVKLAEAYGIYGARIEREDEISSILAAAFDQEGPCIVDARVDPFENVYPMVPPGGSNRDMILGPPVAKAV